MASEISSSSIAIPIALYRPHFGPEARIGKKTAEKWIWARLVGGAKTGVLANRVFACVTPAIFVIFAVFRGLKSKLLVFVDRECPFVIFAVFVKTPCFRLRPRFCPPELGKMGKIAEKWENRHFPVLPFLVFFGKWQGKPPKKQGFFIPTEPLKSLERREKHSNKKTRNSLQGQKTRNSKKQGKEGQGLDCCPESAASSGYRSKPSEDTASLATREHTKDDSGKKKAHKHKSFWPVTPPVTGLKVLCTIFGTQGREIFLSGYPTGRTSDRGDRKKFCVQKFYVPFLRPNDGTASMGTAQAYRRGGPAS